MICPTNNEKIQSLNLKNFKMLFLQNFNALLTDLILNTRSFQAAAATSGVKNDTSNSNLRLQLTNVM
jgi:hypothetical protein